jgi:hypothetical protein
MARVSFDPDEMNKPRFPIFTEGTWGPGGDVEAVCEIELYEYPAMKNPAYDKEATLGAYALFSLKATPTEGAIIREELHVEQNRALFLLRSLGIDVDEDGGHDTSDATGQPILVVAGAPREWNDKKYSNVKTILPL